MAWKNNVLKVFLFTCIFEKIRLRLNSSSWCSHALKRAFNIKPMLSCCENQAAVPPFCRTVPSAFLEIATKTNRSYLIAHNVLWIFEALTKSSSSSSLYITATVSQHTRVHLSPHSDGKCVIPENVAMWYMPLHVTAPRLPSSFIATLFKRWTNDWGKLCHPKRHHKLEMEIKK